VASPFAGFLFDVPRLRSVGVLDETVHERVRRLRERKHLSQAELAAATGDVVTESWLQKFENKGQPKNPTREQLAPLADPLGVDLAYLMAPMGVKPIESDDQAVHNWPHRMREDPSLPDELKDAIDGLAKEARKLREAGKER
jgi:transcriptional regulator with XRE-family HTH domain